MKSLSKSEIQKVKKLYQIGIGIEKIADTFKVTENTIYQICKNTKRIG